jgi:hypothetical protein
VGGSGTTSNCWTTYSSGTSTFTTNNYLVYDGTLTYSSSTTANSGNGAWVELGMAEPIEYRPYEYQYTYVTASDRTPSREPAPPPDPELVAWLHAESEWRLVERDRAQQAVTERAEALLCSLLSEPQRQAYRLHGTFEVIGSEGTVYRIHRGTAGNVEWRHLDGRSGGRLCAHPTLYCDGGGRLPTADVMLAQMLALSTDELHFLRTANADCNGYPPVFTRAGR